MYSKCITMRGFNLFITSRHYMLPHYRRFGTSSPVLRYSTHQCTCNIAQWCTLRTNPVLSLCAGGGIQNRPFHSVVGKPRKEDKDDQSKLRKNELNDARAVTGKNPIICVFRHGDQHCVISRPEAVLLVQKHEMKVIELLGANAEHPVFLLSKHSEHLEEKRYQKRLTKSDDKKTVKALKLSSSIGKSDTMKKIDDMKEFLHKGIEVRLSIQKNKKSENPEQNMKELVELLESSFKDIGKVTYEAAPRDNVNILIRSNTTQVQNETVDKVDATDSYHLLRTNMIESAQGYVQGQLQGQGQGHLSPLVSESLSSMTTHKSTAQDEISISEKQTVEPEPLMHNVETVKTAEDSIAPFVVDDIVPILIETEVTQKEHIGEITKPEIPSENTTHTVEDIKVETLGRFTENEVLKEEAEVTLKPDENLAPIVDNVAASETAITEVAVSEVLKGEAEVTLKPDENLTPIVEHVAAGQHDIKKKSGISSAVEAEQQEALAKLREADVERKLNELAEKQNLADAAVARKVAVEKAAEEKASKVASYIASLRKKKEERTSKKAAEDSAILAKQPSIKKPAEEVASNQPTGKSSIVSAEVDAKKAFDESVKQDVAEEAAPELLADHLTINVAVETEKKKAARNIIALLTETEDEKLFSDFIGKLGTKGQTRTPVRLSDIEIDLTEETGESMKTATVKAAIKKSRKEAADKKSLLEISQRIEKANAYVEQPVREGPKLLSIKPPTRRRKGVAMIQRAAEQSAIERADQKSMAYEAVEAASRKATIVMKAASSAAEESAQKSIQSEMVKIPEGVSTRARMKHLFPSGTNNSHIKPVSTLKKKVIPKVVIQEDIVFPVKEEANTPRTLSISNSTTDLVFKPPTRRKKSPILIRPDLNALHNAATAKLVTQSKDAKTITEETHVISKDDISEPFSASASKTDTFFEINSIETVIQPKTVVLQESISQEPSYEKVAEVDLTGPEKSTSESITAPYVEMDTIKTVAQAKSDILEESVYPETYETVAKDALLKKSEYEMATEEVNDLKSSYTIAIKEIRSLESAYEAAAKQSTLYKSAYDIALKDVTSKKSTYETAEKEANILKAAFDMKDKQVADIKNIHKISIKIAAIKKSSYENANQKSIEKKNAYEVANKKASLLKTQYETDLKNAALRSALEMIEGIPHASELESMRNEFENSTSSPIDSTEVDATKDGPIANTSTTKPNTEMDIKTAELLAALSNSENDALEKQKTREVVTEINELDIAPRTSTNIEMVGETSDDVAAEIVIETQQTTGEVEVDDAAKRAALDDAAKRAALDDEAKRAALDDAAKRAALDDAAKRAALIAALDHAEHDAQERQRKTKPTAKKMTDHEIANRRLADLEMIRNMAEQAAKKAEEEKISQVTESDKVMSPEAVRNAIYSRSKKGSEQHALNKPSNEIIKDDIEKVSDEIIKDDIKKVADESVEVPTETVQEVVTNIDKDNAVYEPEVETNEKPIGIIGSLLRIWRS